MKAIRIGLDAAGKELFITPELRQSTHTHVIGGSGTGKSKFLEWLIRQDIRAGNGLCLIDWHGTLYNDVLRYCSHLEVGQRHDFRSLVLINPSQPKYVTGFNPFVSRGEDVSTQVSRRIDATIRPWGITDTNQMPTFERICRLLYTFAVENNQTLTNAALLLQFDKPELREFAIQTVSDPYIRDQWRQLQQIKTFKDWREFVLSTENRLGRFLGSKTIQRFMGMTEGNIDLIEAMDKGKIVLVNLGSSGYLDREAARVFASLFLNEFFESAMQRATNAPAGKKPSTFTLYLDEFQEYITDDIGSMLDQVRKGGLHMVLAHQHLGHLSDNPRLLQSVLTNARIRAVFGGLPYTDACMLTNEMFLPDLNTRQIKKAYYHTIHLYQEETRVSQTVSNTRGTNDSSSWSRGMGSSTATTRGEGSTTGSSTASGGSYGSGYGTTTTIGHSNNQSAGTTEPAAVGLELEGWSTESAGSSESHSSSVSNSSFEGRSYSDTESQSKSESESISHATSESSSIGGSTGKSHALSTGYSVVPVWVPIPVQELGSEAEWSREEKVSKVAEMLKTQQQRHCFIKLDTELTQPLQVPFVQDYSSSPESLLEYEEASYKGQGALLGEQVDTLLSDSRQQFISASLEAISAPEEPIKEAKPRRASSKRPIYTQVNLDDD